MHRPLSLLAYIALRRGGMAAAVDRPQRPSGPMLWVQCPDPDRLGAISALVERLRESLPDLSAVVTTQAEAHYPGLFIERVPEENRADVRAFMTHWRPDVVLWLGGALRPVILSETLEEVPGILADVEAPGLLIEGDRWLPGVLGALVAEFRSAVAVDGAAASLLRRNGLEADRITVRGKLDFAEAPLPGSERERADLAQVIGARPTWLAAEVPMDELQAVIDAHRRASRRAHRLLLLLVPAGDVSVDAMASVFEEQGLSVRSRAFGEEPDDLTQVYLADGSGEMGLWYRLAPVTYFGGTLTGGGSRSPYEAAALGSAILHGPATAPRAAAYDRLQSAGASRRISSKVELGNALEQLLSPDRSATLAHAAWVSVSDGAEVQEHLAGILLPLLAETVA
jgi:3-deoxy-D-manno-octulosonic-acid transferase